MAEIARFRKELLVGIEFTGALDAALEEAHVSGSAPHVQE